ncbi:hypothetical protein C4565_00560 [Candidatus Parcubacteria bacterium]|nr:MAG: hypothetical protein C4565_00560 [Candidatus Parcubacteria bacterium]
MTKQEYYDLLVCSALDGTFPSVSQNGTCLYRAPGNKRCAAGLLISDNLYDGKMESKSVEHEMVEKVLTIPDGMCLKDIFKCQETHDWEARNTWNSKRFLTRINSFQVFDDVQRILGYEE